MVDMMDGKKVDQYDDPTGLELSNLGWFPVKTDLHISDNEQGVHDWLKDNISDHYSDVRWYNGCLIYFRKEDEAMAFKLAWY